MNGPQDFRQAEKLLGRARGRDRPQRALGPDRRTSLARRCGQPDLTARR